MAKAKRVFEIAKELGVASKAIVSKCKAEGVPGVTNHMSTVKIGLEQTIHEWFSDTTEDAPHTAIEIAEPVDLTKARRARRRRANAVETDAPAVESVSPAASAEESQSIQPETLVSYETPIDETSDTPALIAAEQEEPPTMADETIETVQEQPDSNAGLIVAQEQVQDEAPTESENEAETDTQAQMDPSKSVGPVGKPNVPDRPKIVTPGGTQLTQPKETTLKGPQIVRIERPEVVETPVRRSPPAGGGGRSRFNEVPVGGAGVSGRGRPMEPEPRTGPDRGGGGRSPTKRRSLSTRRGRTAEALPAGPSKFSEQDLIELDARLNRATGFLKQRRRSLRKQSSNAGGAAVSPAVSGGTVVIAEPISIKALSAVTGIKSTDIIKYLFKKGVMATINSAIDAEAAMEIALEYDIDLEVQEQQTAEQLVLEEFETRKQIDVRPRPAVVTVLGHVDHGKTSLLDRIRASDVAAHEAGGITQHVGAYRVTVQGHDGKEKTVVFLDTPGHEAFTSMRSRGASMTDLVVLVVAADDGVMPQTIESINHAKAANVPIIVALNKIDKAEATEENIRKIYGQLAEHGLNTVEWGGDTEVIKVSAQLGTGTSDLVEVLDYQAELLELSADYAGTARGTVIEAQMQPGRGPVARVLVQQGHIKVGDFIVIGRSFGRVRDMTDDRGRSITQAGPATPLELSGIDMVPNAGNKFYVTTTLQKAEQVAKQYREAERSTQLANKSKVTLDNFADKLAANQDQELRIVLKADVQGSIDVLRKTLSEIGSDEVSVKVLHAAVGGITESDILLADASDAVVIGFHVVASPYARELAEQRGVQVRLYRVIYELIDSLKRALEGMLEPETKEQTLGTLEVRQVFKITKLGQVAGCLVVDGMVQRNAKMRLIRDDVVVTENREIESLRRVKDDAKEVRAGTECGVRLVGFDDVKPGDQLVCYQTIHVPRTLE